MGQLGSFIVVAAVVCSIFLLLAALSDTSLRITDAMHVRRRRRILRKMRRRA